MGAPRAMTALKFTKMQGLGNDFVVLDGIRQRVALSPAQIRLLADRRFGVGCDQVLLVEKATGDADFRYRIFNADGGEVEQCGNGARCFVVFVRDQGLTDQARVARRDGRRRSSCRGSRPTGRSPWTWACRASPPKTCRSSEAAAASTTRSTSTATPVRISVLSMGNPHAVQVVADVDAAPVTTQGPRIEHHPRFPQRVNAGYMQVVDRATIRLRVWERGAGETLACGTGACAAVVAGMRRGLLDSPVRVQVRGGELTIAWAGDGQPVQMTGPAATVFEGEWNA